MKDFCDQKSVLKAHQSFALKEEAIGGPTQLPDALSELCGSYFLSRFGVTTH